MHLMHFKHLLTVHLHRPILFALALWLVGFGVLGLGAISLADPPPGHPFHGRLDKVLHFSAFSILAVLLFALPRYATGPRSDCIIGERFVCVAEHFRVKRWYIRLRLAFAGAVGGVLAVMSEVVQHSVNPGRVFDWFDILANLLGVALGLLLASLAWNVHMTYCQPQAQTARTMSSTSDLV